MATDARGFMQASFSSDQILADLVEQYLPQEKGALVDLFCGRGTFSLPLSKCFSVDGFEWMQPRLRPLKRLQKER